MRAFQRSRSGGRFLTTLLLFLTIVAAAPGSALAESTGVARSLTSHPPRLPESGDVTPTATETANGSAGLRGNVYLGIDFPFRVTFDESVWTNVKPYERATGYEGFSLRSDATIGAIEAFADADLATDCVAASMSRLGQQAGFSNVHQAPDLDAPASAPGVDAAMFTFDISFGEGVTPYTGYVECRELVKGASVLRIQLAAPNVQLDDAFPTWAPLLSGIELTGTTDSASANATPSVNDGIENVVGNAYTSPRFGFSISWPDAYTPAMAYYDNDMDGDVLVVEHGRTVVYLSSGAVADYSVADCFSFAESLIKDGKNTNVRLMTTKGGQPMRSVSDALSYALYGYTMPGTNGPADLVEYIQCQADPTGTYALDFSFMTPAESYTKTSADLKAILDSIQFA